VISTLLAGITGYLASFLKILSIYTNLNVTFSAIDIINIFICSINITIGVVLIVSKPVKIFLTFRREDCQEESNINESVS
jgi:hypothetical protein